MGPGEEGREDGGPLQVGGDVTGKVKGAPEDWV